jgi:hypothetical protein
MIGDEKMKRVFLFCFVIVLLTIPSCSTQPTREGEVTPTSTILLKTPSSTSGIPRITLMPSETQSTPSNPTESPEITKTPTPTLTTLPPVHTPPPNIPVPPSVLFVLQPGTPITLTNFPHPELQCGWMGIGGQAFGMDTKPITGLIVELKGKLSGNDIYQLSLTGTATMWGPGGYEFQLANHPIASDGSLWIQLYDLHGTIVSDKIYFTTYDDCSRNSIIINFQKIAENGFSRQYLPLFLSNANPRG